MSGKIALRWILMACFSGVFLFVVASVNFAFDRQYIFHEEEDSHTAAQEMLHGGRVTLKGLSMPAERQVKYQLACDMPGDRDCIIVGPSITMCIGEEDAASGDSVNLGVSNASYYDVMAFLGSLAYYEKLPKRVIFAVDSFFFDREMLDSDSAKQLSFPTMDYCAFMEKLVLGQEVKMENPAVREPGLQRIISGLFSLSDFQDSVDEIRVSGLGNQHIGLNESDVIMINNENADEHYYYMPDGSFVYPKKIREAGVSQVLKDAESYDVEGYFMSEHPDEYCMEMFEKTIWYLQSQGTDVELFLCPMAPALWDREDVSSLPMLSELQAYGHELADKYGLKITGSYNPYDLGMTNEDFYDARHVKREKLSTYFDFTSD